MRFPIAGVRPRRGLISLVLTSLLAGSTAFAALSLAAPDAWAGFGVEKWEAGTCKESSCNIEGKDPSAEFYTQAAGHPNSALRTSPSTTKKSGYSSKRRNRKVKSRAYAWISRRAWLWIPKRSNSAPKQ